MKIKLKISRSLRHIMKAFVVPSRSFLYNRCGYLVFWFTKKAGYTSETFTQD